ncbi:MAG: 23S rRNA (uridine2552-2'-O)-methyltransferase [Alphaproteobacteria bacterium]|nr:23S rRNA (uridine2552-2'-O)-methyltransferase [Alphaproteobacteria bacterium]
MNDKIGGAGRDLTVRVKTARKRSTSSTRWLQRQLNDPYVAAARREGYRSRAAYKLLEIDDQHHLLRKGARVLDLGATPGGWTQVCVARTGAGKVLAVDINEMDAVAGAQFMQIDFLSPEAPERIRTALGGDVDIVLSDMASPATGHRMTDHARIIALCDLAYEFACEVLAPGGTFCAKVLQGGTEAKLLIRMKQMFTRVQHVKPKASRADSKEIYVLATGFRGSILVE